MEPKAITVTRYVCPGCRWSSSRKATITDHLTRCWRNPDNRACKTCAHFDPGYCCRDASDQCGCRGEAEPACAKGRGMPFGPLVNVDCDLWEPASCLEVAS